MKDWKAINFAARI